jgi:hypothetical protein
MPNNLSRLTLVSLVMILSGCASIIEGRSEQILVNTSPDGASCSFVRNNEPIGTVTPTPNSIMIEKTKYDIMIKCNKPGYDEATYFGKSGIDDWVFGNILFGGLIGWGIDSATGSDNYYDTPINITLPKK